MTYCEQTNYESAGIYMVNCYNEDGCLIQGCTFDWDGSNQRCATNVSPSNPINCGHKEIPSVD